MNASNAYISCRCVMQRTDLYRARVLSVTNSRLIPKSSCCPYSRRHIQTFAAHPKLHSAPIKTKCPPQRRIHIPTLLIPPLAFASLFIALNFYKNLVLILFQNRIIYMPSMPPFARRERIADYAAVCRPVTWREERIHAVDGTELALAVGEVEGQKEEKKKSDPAGVERKGTHLVIIYFQGSVFPPPQNSNFHFQPAKPRPSTPPFSPYPPPQKRLLHTPLPTIHLFRPYPPPPPPPPPTIQTLLPTSTNPTHHHPCPLLPRLLDLSRPTLRTRHPSRCSCSPRPRPPHISIQPGQRDTNRAMGPESRRRCSHCGCYC